MRWHAALTPAELAAFRETYWQVVPVGREFGLILTNEPRMKAPLKTTWTSFESAVRAAIHLRNS